MKTEILAAATAALCAGGCIQLKTESEIKPIHITMDVNLKVDRELDKAFADESRQTPSGDFKVARDLLNRKAAGVTRLAMLEARAEASDDDKIAVADENSRRLKRFSAIAKSNGMTLESVQKRHAARMRDRVPAGIWLQADDGRWFQKK